MLSYIYKPICSVEAVDLNMAETKFDLPVPSAKYCVVSFPAPSIVLVRLNRPNELNCVNMEGHAELDAIWSWLDAEPNLSCGIITGTGRAFSAGADSER